MVFWGFSLILAVSFLGRQAEAVPRPQGEGGQIGQVGQHHKHPGNPARITMGETTTAAAAPVGTAANAGLGDSGAFTSSQNSDTLGPTGATPTVTTSTSVASTSIASSTPTFNYFESIWHADQSYTAHIPADVSYSIPRFPDSSNGNPSPFSPVLFICQTSQNFAPNGMNSSNTWAVAHIPNVNRDAPIKENEQQNSLLNIQLISVATRGTTVNPGASFFFCLANNTTYIDRFICDSYGPFFTIEAPQKNRRDLSPRQVTVVPDMPTTVLSITSFSSGISVLGATITATAPKSSMTSLTTTSMPFSETTTTTVQPSSTSAPVPFSFSTGSHGLSTGAKVGIALGALVLVAALLLAALFFLRRKHRSRSPPPEQVMLTRDMHTDSFGRNALITEKETAAAHNIANGASPVDENLPIQRHSTHSPTAYDSIPAASYSGSASGVPRRKPTNASAVSRISGPASPRSLTVSTPPDEYEEYRDQPMPVYGDARHSPRVYSTEERQGVKAPFLHTDEGMSAEEVARLEEEERRIDAAIAEAERSGRR